MDVDGGSAHASADVVVLGSGQAGHQLVSSLRLNGYQGRVALIGEEHGLPYQRPPLSKEFLVTADGCTPVELTTAEQYVSNAIELRAGVNAVSVDRRGHQVELASGAVLDYQHLVFATGVRARRLQTPGSELKGVYTLRTLADARVIRSCLERCKSVVVIGAGFIGLEFASVASGRGLKVTVLEAADEVMKRVLSARTARFLAGRHREVGVDVRTGVSVAEFAASGRHVRGVRLATGELIEAELVVVGIGVEPNVDLAQAAGLAVGNGIIVDEYLRTDDPAIFAIGDCANYPSRFARGRVRVESVQNAVDQARCVADALTGRQAPYQAVPWFWSHQAGHKLQIAGLSAGHDATVVRDGGDGTFSVFCYRDEELIAVESVDRPADHMAARRLLGAGASVSPAQAADLSVNIKQLARAHVASLGAGAMAARPLMRAARFDLGAGKLVVKDVPRPRPSSGEVLVRVAAASVSLSDVRIIQGLDVPRSTSGELTLGHEVAGTVAAPGAGVHGWPLGRRVLLYPVAAGKDGERLLGVDYDGGWADYVVAPAETLVPIGDRLPFDQAAVLPDAVATPWSALTATARVRPGQCVGIWGVGGRGAHAVQLARLIGAAPVIAVDPLGAARERALKLGADAALDPAGSDFRQRLLAAGYGQLPDVAIDFTGLSASQHQALGSLAPKGKAVYVGLSGAPITIKDSTSFSVYGRQVLGHFGSRYSDLPLLIRLAELGRLDLSRSVTEVVSLEDAADAIQRPDQGTGDPVRLVLRPQRASETG